ncbi:LysR family transcriptional regulator [Lentzea flava]|uniref:LysR family transcriptional regulator n=1 Tax=Lentzea flava TaxID=103732 RepID=A0ABQ2UMA6_9PSEU|nr:LysR family transcriptional regulator [Lentzea flava]MCP2200615.1 DNA-binding transcriptional regulator, LysR family [Lentzea flava]GGU43961.1 LysR family transcriptional regulator [Lentzea flava]
MRLRQIEYFVAICEAGSFNRAANELRVAQPSLSQQIQALEKELGAELLERGRQGISLTAAGRIFLPQARAVLAAVESARRSVADLVRGMAGELHVLTVRSVASGVLPAAVVRWHEHHPTTVLRLHDYSHRRDLEAALRGGRGDLAIGPRPRDWDGDITTLGFERLVLAGRGPFDAGRATSAELAEGKWVGFEPEQGMSEVLDWAARSLGFTPRLVARVGQVTAALRLAVEGVGLTIVPANAVPHGWSAHVRSLDPPLYRELTVYGRGPMVHLARRFVDLVGSVELPLVSRPDLPADALVC